MVDFSFDKHSSLKNMSRYIWQTNYFKRLVQVNANEVDCFEDIYVCSLEMYLSASVIKSVFERDGKYYFQPNQSGWSFEYQEPCQRGLTKDKV